MQINAVKALVRDFDLMSNVLPHVACDLGEGYVFSPEKKDHHHIPLEGSKKILHFRCTWRKYILNAGLLSCL